MCVGRGGQAAGEGPTETLVPSAVMRMRPLANQEVDPFQGTPPSGESCQAAGTWWAPSCKVVWPAGEAMRLRWGRCAWRRVSWHMERRLGAHARAPPRPLFAALSSAAWWEVCMAVSLGAQGPETHPTSHPTSSPLGQQQDPRGEQVDEAGCPSWGGLGDGKHGVAIVCVCACTRVGTGLGKLSPTA